MLNKEDLFGFLKEAGIKHDDKLTIHCSLRSIGKIDKGADGLIDAFIEYLKDGLFRRTLGIRYAKRLPVTM